VSKAIRTSGVSGAYIEFLGTTFTSFHLFFEEDAAKLLGIPFETIMQIALIPVAYTKGTRFKPGPRDPVGTILHWNDW
jgi:hypothetical protein